MESERTCQQVMFRYGFHLVLCLLFQLLCTTAFKSEKEDLFYWLILGSDLITEEWLGYRLLGSEIDLQCAICRFSGPRVAVTDSDSLCQAQKPLALLSSEIITTEGHRGWHCTRCWGHEQTCLLGRFLGRSQGILWVSANLKRLQVAGSHKLTGKKNSRAETLPSTEDKICFDDRRMSCHTSVLWRETKNRSFWAMGS